MLNPPSVEGWHTGREWIDSSFLIERVNFAVERLTDVTKPGVRKIIDLIGGMRSSFTAPELLDACLYAMGCWVLEEKSRRIILDDIGKIDLTPGSDSFDATTTRMMGYIASSREFQMA